MKKNGFTLAEVLITLAIIGVVATLTLPSLMSNTQEQQSITAFKKAMNTLNEVAQMNAVVDGFDYSGVQADTAATATSSYDANGILKQSVWDMMRTKAQVDEQTSIKKPLVGACNGKMQIFFRDGTVLCYDKITNGGTSKAYIKAWVDTNGLKGPNQISTCGDGNDPQCVKTATKKIRDQYRITLIGSNAVPGHVEVGDDGTIKYSATNNSEDLAAAYAMRK